MIIGIGNKARQGKDTLAALVKEINPNCTILHFADGLNQEVSEKGPPLIIKLESDDIYYALRNAPRSYDVFQYSCVPKIHQIFTERNITSYEYMKEKDPEILQFWGTDYRRKFYGEDYWIRTLAKNIKVGEHYLIPDTRFLNEYEYIKRMQGIYVSVKRVKEGGTVLLDSKRDSKHISETQLDNVLADIEVVVQDGDFNRLRTMAKLISQTLK